jgi:hypothetical protein
MNLIATVAVPTWTSETSVLISCQHPCSSQSFISTFAKCTNKKTARITLHHMCLSAQDIQAKLNLLRHPRSTISTCPSQKLLWRRRSPPQETFRRAWHPGSHPIVSARSRSFRRAESRSRECHLHTRDKNMTVRERVRVHACVRACAYFVRNRPGFDTLPVPTYECICACL